MTNNDELMKAVRRFNCWCGLDWACFNVNGTACSSEHLKTANLEPIILAAKRKYAAKTAKVVEV